MNGAWVRLRLGLELDLSVRYVRHRGKKAITAKTNKARVRGACQNNRGKPESSMGSCTWLGSMSSG